ncbi:hypothetical protein D3C78_1330030 [compost metagenome]
MLEAGNSSSRLSINSAMAPMKKPDGKRSLKRLNSRLPMIPAAPNSNSIRVVKFSDSPATV